MLLDQGADPNFENKEKETALRVAKERKKTLNLKWHKEILELIENHIYLKKINFNPWMENVFAENTICF